jgi:hypothetical protein
MGGFILPYRGGSVFNKGVQYTMDVNRPRVQFTMGFKIPYDTGLIKANFLSLNFNLVVDVIITYICLSVLIQVIWSYGVLIGCLSSTSTKFILVLILLESFMTES